MTDLLALARTWIPLTLTPHHKPVRGLRDHFGRYRSINPTYPEWFGPCPFHNDHSQRGAFYVIDYGSEGMVYHCFACGAHGGLRAFIERFDPVWHELLCAP